MSYELDERGHSVVRALENPKYNWRTIEGISEETGIDAHQVAQILQFLPNKIDLVRSRDRLGRQLFTTRDHYYKTQNVLNRILSTFSDRIR
jgi:hypothetical protein